MKRLATPLVVALTIVIIAAAVLGLILSMTAPGGHDLNPVSRFIYLSNPLVLGAIGGALLVRMPRHWAGRAMVVSAVAFDLDSLAKGVLQHHSVNEQWTRGLAEWASWLDNWTWTIVIGATLFIVLKFAGGTRYGRRLRAVGWAGIGVFVALGVIAASAPTSVEFDNVRTIAHLGVAQHQVVAIVAVLFPLAGIGFLFATAALIVHWKHAAGAEQAQLRWLLWAFGFVVGVQIVDAAMLGVLDLLSVHPTLLVNGMDAVQELSVFAIPIAIYISITRHGLFEIDRVISRTVSYSLLTLTLTVCYGLIATLAARLVPDRLGSLPVAAATLAVVALFVPVRRRMTAVIDRRFNRNRYDAQRLVAAFAERVRRDGADDPNGRDLLDAVRVALEPASASVWLAPTASGTRR